MKNLWVFIIFTSLFCGEVTFGQNKPRSNTDQNPSPTSDIVGGSNTTIDQQPWQVLLNTGCGGSIIGPNTILTAAHCVAPYSASQLIVYAGVTFISQRTSGQVRGVSKISIHPNYNSSTVNADIAVLELSSPIAFNADAQPIRFDGGTGIEFEGNLAFISGWGNTGTSSSAPDQLQSAAVGLGDINSLQQNQYNFPLNSGMIPAGGTVSTCNGDSGGPLWVNNNGQSFLVGVTSAKAISGCGSSNPAIFTRVSSYCQWVLQQVSDAANIVGSGALCNSASYSVNNQPLNTTVTWSSSNPNALSINNSGIATRQNNFNDIVTITATFSNNCGSGNKNRSVTVGPPLLSSILVNSQSTNPANVCINNFASLDAVPFDVNSSYSWSLSDPGNGYLTNSGSASTAFNPYTANCYELSLQVSNACGFIQRSQTICAQNCFARYKVYPNPAKDYIAVDFETIDNKSELPDQIILLDEKTSKPLRSINVQEEFDKKNFTDGRQIRLNVGELKRGVYYLHIKNSRLKDKELDAIRIILE
jgi:hypothetical protein